MADTRTAQRAERYLALGGQRKSAADDKLCRPDFGMANLRRRDSTGRAKRVCRTTNGSGWSCFSP